MSRDKGKDNPGKGAYGLKPLELPDGLGWEDVRRAQRIIEEWEDTPGVSDLDLIVRLYQLFETLPGKR